MSVNVIASTPPFDVLPTYSHLPGIFNLGARNGRILHPRAPAAASFFVADPRPLRNQSRDTESPGNASVSQHFLDCPSPKSGRRVSEPLWLWPVVMMSGPSD